MNKQQINQYLKKSLDCYFSLKAIGKDNLATAILGFSSAVAKLNLNILKLQDQLQEQKNECQHDEFEIVQEESCDPEFGFQVYYKKICKSCGRRIE